MSATWDFGPEQKGSRIGANFCKGISVNAHDVRELGSTHRHLAKRQTLNLVCTCAPVDGAHQAVPQALDQIGLRDRRLLLLGLDRGNNLTERVDQTLRGYS